MGRPPNPIPTTTRAGQIGTRIRAARLAAGLTIRQAAVAAGLSYAYWSELESGGQAERASIAVLDRVAAAVGRDAAELLS